MTKSKKQKAKRAAQRGKRSRRRPVDRLTNYPLLPSHMDLTLVHNVRSQISVSAFNVYNFETLSLQTLQPYYRDQLLAIWRNYVVMGVTVETMVVNKSTSVDAEMITYYGTGSTIAALTFAQALEWKNTKRTLISTSGSNKVIRTTRTVWNRELLPAGFEDDSEMWGTAAAGPPYSTTEGVQFANGFLAADGTSTMSLTMDRRIKFHVRFFSPAPLTNSLTLESDDLPVLQLPRGPMNPNSPPYYPQNPQPLRPVPQAKPGTEPFVDMKGQKRLTKKQKQQKIQELLNTSSSSSSFSQIESTHPDPFRLQPAPFASGIHPDRAAGTVKAPVSNSGA